MKKVISFYLKTVLIGLLLLIVISKFSLLSNLAGKIDRELPDPDRITSLFYYLPKDSVELLFLGDSHSYCTYISQDIYDELGITSASLATSSNSIINQYWQLKEALKRQSLKMVVLETHPIELAGDNEPSNVYLHFTSGISNIPDYSFNKIKNYLDIKRHPYGIADKITYFDVYNFTRYKEDFNRNYEDIIKDSVDLLVNPSGQFITFGYYPTVDVEVLNKKYTTYENNKKYLDFSKTLEYEYLIKIYDLCKDNDIELVLSRAIYFEQFDFHYFNEQIDDWASRNGVDVIDYFKLVDECGFDFLSDFRDQNHFNYLGAKKATHYFINYLSKKNLTTNLNNDKCKLWENNDFDYNKIEEQITSKIKTK